MSDQNSIQKKFERWFLPVPQKEPPVQAAAVVIAMRDRISKDDWGEDGLAQSDVLSSLNAIIGLLYHAHAKDRKSGQGQLKKEAAFYNRHSLPMTPGEPVKIPVRLFEQYNKISSSDKKDFLRRASRLSKDAGYTYNDLLSKTAGVFRIDHYGTSEFVAPYRDYLSTLHKNLGVGGSAYSSDHENKNSVPKDGPKNPQDLAFCCIAFLAWSYKTENTFEALGVEFPHLDNVRQAIDEVFSLSDIMQSDISLEQREKAYFDAGTVIDRMTDSHYMRLDNFLGLMHFYLQHNQEKIMTPDYTVLQAAHTKVVAASFLDDLADFGEMHVGSCPSTDPVFIEICQKLYTDYPKPSADDVADQVIEEAEKKLKGNPAKRDRVIRNFEETRAQKPDQMDEVVLLHYRESDDIRKIRKSLFRKEKTDFLKGLAADHSNDLYAVGLSDNDIDQMAQDGKIPEGSGLTVEHIIDREHGGTNHAHNFILMSAEINAQKDLLKKSQMHALSDSDAGCWIVSWVPKKDEDGMYPFIYMDDDMPDINPKASSRLSWLPDFVTSHLDL